MALKKVTLDPIRLGEVLLSKAFEDPEEEGKFLICLKNDVTLILYPKKRCVELSIGSEDPKSGIELSGVTEVKEYHSSVLFKSLIRKRKHSLTVTSDGLFFASINRIIRNKIGYRIKNRSNF